MINHILVIRKFSELIEDRLIGKSLLQANQFADELLLHFTDDITLKFNIGTNKTLYCLQETLNHSRKNIILASFQNTRILKAGMLECDRSIFLEFEGKKHIILKMYGAAGNVIAYEKKDAVWMLNNSFKDRDKKLKKIVKINLDDFLKDDSVLDLYRRFKSELILSTDEEVPDSPISELYSFSLDVIENSQIKIGFKRLGKTTDFECILWYYKKYLGNYINQSLVKKRRKELESSLNAFRKKVKSTELSLNRIKSGVQLKEKADLIMANLAQIKKGQKTVDLISFDGTKTISIRLKPQLSASENAARYYKKGKQEYKRIEHLKSYLDSLNQKLISAEDELINVGNLSTKELRQSNDLKDQSKNKIQPFRIFESQNTIIWVGKDAKSNEEILKKSDKNDLWLHAKSVSGSHVLIRKNYEEVNESLLEVAASLAAYYSKAKGHSYHPVVFTPRKFVRKAKGLSAGKVIVQKEKTITAEVRSPSQLGF